MVQNTSIDTQYLDQIANSVAPKRPTSPLILWSIIGGVLVLLFASIAGINALISSGVNKHEQLYARLLATQDINNDAAAKLKSSNLRALNVSLKAQLATVLRDIEQPIAKHGVDPKAINEKITAEENPVKTLEELESARLNGQFDTSFARTMSYKIATVLILMEEIHKKSSSDDLKAILETAFDSLQVLQNELEDFSSINT
jgi:hypothetical protein